MFSRSGRFNVSRHCGPYSKIFSWGIWIDPGDCESGELRTGWPIKVLKYTAVVWYFLTLILGFVLDRWRSVNVYPLACYWWATTDFPRSLSSSAETLSVRSKFNVYQTSWSRCSELYRGHQLMKSFSLQRYLLKKFCFPKMWIFC